MNAITRHTAVICLLAATLCAAAQHTTRRHLRRAPQTAVAPHEPADTLTGAQADSTARFSGYEKALRASRETLFVTNRGHRPIQSLEFTVTYFDSAGRQLHRRVVRATAPIPPGETRRVDFPTWDTQRSFYSTTGRPPRVAAIPYTVTVTSPKVIVLND